MPEPSPLYTTDLPTQARPEQGRVLVTGATGYIGGQLVPELLARGYQVRAMVRAASPEHASRWPGAEIVVADAANPTALLRALDDVHTAYYLIHSLLLGRGRFEAADRHNADCFRHAAEQAGVQRIIYLGGLGDARTALSAHLRSRMEVAEALRSETVRLTVLRAAIIMGSGSASYEIIHHLVRNLPVILIPDWAKTRCQPIAIRDVLRYLVGVLETPDTVGQAFDIGGPDILTYAQMMRALADVLGKRRLFVPVPRWFSHVGFYAYFGGLLTPVPAPVVTGLMDSLHHDVVCESDTIRSHIPSRLLTYRESIVEAMTHEEQDRVHARWSDAYPPAHELAIRLAEVDPPPRYRTQRSITTDRPASALFVAICKVGGKHGWFHSNWLWRLRGTLDNLMQGVGTRRGRRSATELRVNDVVDFWRVEDLVPDRRLLLRAEMILPGEAWLEFRIEPAPTGATLAVIAWFDTHRIVGHLYWYILMPTHRYLFDNLLRQIVRRCPRAEHAEHPE